MPANLESYTNAYIWNPEFFRVYAVLLAAGLLIKRIRPYVLGMIALLCAYYVLRDARYFKYTWAEELYKKDLYNLDNHDGVITDLEPDILECEVKLVETLEFQLSSFKS